MKKGWFLLLSLVAVFFVSVAIAGLAEELKDPVCGMKLDSAKAKFSAEYKGKKYYFCSANCRDKFNQNPEKYAGSSQQISEEEVICCSLSKELLAEVRVERKERRALKISMTSSNPEVVKRLQETLAKCHQEMMAGGHAQYSEEGKTREKHAHGEHMAQHQHVSGESQTQAACCLMHDQDYDVKLVNLKNGVRLELRKKS